MKKILFVSFLVISQAFCVDVGSTISSITSTIQSLTENCWCKTSINSDFLSLKSTISTALTNQKTQLSLLKSAIESAISKIETQNNKLDKRI